MLPKCINCGLSGVLIACYIVIIIIRYYIKIAFYREKSAQKSFKIVTNLFFNFIKH